VAVLTRLDNRTAHLLTQLSNNRHYPSKQVSTKSQTPRKPAPASSAQTRDHLDQSVAPRGPGRRTPRTVARSQEGQAGLAPLTFSRTWASHYYKPHFVRIPNDSGRETG